MLTALYAFSFIVLGVYVATHSTIVVCGLTPTGEVMGCVSIVRFGNMVLGFLFMAYGCIGLTVLWVKRHG